MDATSADATASAGPERGRSADPEASEPDRTTGQAWTYAAAAVAYLVVPFLLGAALPAGTATAALLILLLGGGLLLGLADGRAFRTTWAFPWLTTILCWIGLQLYTNSGTWIYAVGVLALTRLGSVLGGRRRATG